MVEENKSPRVDPHQLLKALSPLLGPEGEIKGAAEMDRVMSLMRDAKKLVSRCIYLNILKTTTNNEVLERFIGRGGWDMLYTWLRDAKTEDNYSFLVEMLLMYQNIPMTVEILKINNTPKTIKSLLKCDHVDVKTLATHIVDKWMKTLVKKPLDGSSSSSSDRKRSKHRDSDKEKRKHSHHSRHHSSNSKDSEKSNEDNSKSTSKDWERHSSTESMCSSVSDKSEKQKHAAPRTAKAPPSLYRSTGLEQESILPPAKKKVVTVDKEKYLAAKRASSGKATGATPEKRAKSQPSTAAPESHGKIKIIPARPKPVPPPPPPHHVFDSSDFMDALSASAHAAPRRKRKTSAPNNSPSGKKEPTSPTNKSPDTNGKKDPTSPTDKDDAAVPSFYKETMETDEKNGDNENEETKSEDAKDDDSASKTSDSTESGKKKKRVHFADDAHLASVRYFEMDENERVNVNRIKGFEDSRKQDLMMERRFHEAHKRTHDVTGSITWHRPPLITDLPPSPLAMPGANSTERGKQREREQCVLQALYFSKDMIPDSAIEPESEVFDVDEPIDIPLYDESGSGETVVDHSSLPEPKPKAQAPNAAQQFSLPPDIANILGNMAQEYVHNSAGPQQQQQHMPMQLPNDPSNPLNENIQQILNKILDQNPATSQNQDMRAQLQRMMQSAPIREQIQAWAAGQNMSWLGPPPPPNNGIMIPNGPPPGLLPHPNMIPQGMMNRPPPRPHFGGPGPGPGPGQWGNHGNPNMMRGPPPPHAHPPHMGGRGGPRMGMRGGRGGGGMSREGRPVCKHFHTNSCSFGADCKFLHPGVNGPPL